MKFYMCVFIAFSLSVDLCWGQVSFPENSEVDKTKTNAAGRLPLYSPTRCKQNELLFPGDQANDWICDCAPASVYYPETDACYPAFRKGPCAEGEIIVLGKDKIIPECIANPCKIDGQIQIRNKCYEFGKPGPCDKVKLTFVLGVDPKTLQVDCVQLSLQLSLQNRFGEEIKDEKKNEYNFSEIEMCARGTQRAIEGRCPA